MVFTCFYIFLQCFLYVCCQTRRYLHLRGFEHVAKSDTFMQQWQEHRNLICFFFLNSSVAKFGHEATAVFALITRQLLSDRRGPGPNMRILIGVVIPFCWRIGDAGPLPLTFTFIVLDGVGGYNTAHMYNGTMPGILPTPAARNAPRTGPAQRHGEW